MYALPKAMPEYRDAKFSGEIVYNDHTHRVPQGGIDQGFRPQPRQPDIRRIADEKPAIHVPSAAECRFCDISALDCPERSMVTLEPETEARRIFDRIVRRP